MNANIYRSISNLPYDMLQARLNKRIIFPLGLIIQRNIRTVSRLKEEKVSQLKKSLNSDRPEITLMKPQITLSKKPQVSMMKPEDLLPSRVKTSEKKAKPQYPSPTPALLPSQKKQQAIMKLNEDILASSNINIVFDFYIRNRKDFELDQYLFTLERLSQLCRSGSVCIPEVHESKIFQSLCYEVWKAASKMEGIMVLSALKYLLDINVNSKSLIIQSFLQMARHQINLFSVKDLLFLHVLLKKVENCNLKDALQLAIPRTIENSIDYHFPTYLKYNEIMQLLQLCIIGEVKGLNKVLDFIYKTSLPSLLQDKTSPTSVNKDLVSLLTNLLSLDFQKCELDKKDLYIAAKLILNCLNYLAEGNLEELDKHLILIISMKLLKCFNTGLNVYPLHEDFLLKVTEKALEQKWDMKSLLKIIDVQLQMKYVSEELVSLIASNIKEISPHECNVNFRYFITAMASCDLPEEISSEALNFIMRNIEISLDNLKVPWIKIMLELLSMNYFDSNLFKQILEEEFLLRYLKFWENSPRDSLQILRLHKYLKSMKQNSDLEVPATVLSMAKAGVVNSIPSLGNFLSSIVENKDCIISNVITPQYNCIDHIIILDNNGRPNEISKYSIEEMFEKKNDISAMRKFAIIEIPESWTMKPGNKLQGTFKLEMQLIEQEGFVVVPIFQGEIERLREASKIAIKNKFKELGFNFVK